MEPAGQPLPAVTDTRQTFPTRTGPTVVAAPALIGAMLLMLVTLPVSLPVATLLNWNERRRLRTVAAATRCGCCGTLLGPGAPEVSDAAHIAALAKVQRRYPTHRVHVARRTQARCAACGADYVWDRVRRALSPLDDPAPSPVEQVLQHRQRSPFPARSAIGTVVQAELLITEKRIV